MNPSTCEVCDTTEALHACGICGCSFCEEHSTLVADLVENKPEFSKWFFFYCNNVLKKYSVPVGMQSRLCIYCRAVIFSRVLNRARSDAQAIRKILKEVAEHPMPSKEPVVEKLTVGQPVAAKRLIGRVVESIVHFHPARGR